LEIKDDDILVGVCTYENNQNESIYAGNGHTNEMCNIYVFFYSLNGQNLFGFCGGHSYPELEQQIPLDAKIKPSNSLNTVSLPLSPLNDQLYRYMSLVKKFLYASLALLMIFLVVLIKTREYWFSTPIVKKSFSQNHQRSGCFFNWIKNNWNKIFKRDSRVIYFHKLNQNYDEEIDRNI
jgi:hypothetical protein